MARDVDNTVGFHNATFSWSGDQISKSGSGTSSGATTPGKQEFRLHIDGTLHFPVGQLTMVVGPTASGKSSTLMALLGEMHYRPTLPDSWFNLPRQSGVAYAVQETWVLNETIRVRLTLTSYPNIIRLIS